MGGKASVNMPDTLREFVYLDDISLNSHLASLGKALPQQVTEQDESTTETEGGVDVKVLRGERLSANLSGTEIVGEATAPYRFEDLVSELDEKSVDIYENPDPRSLARGDVVRVDGTANPMSLFLVELAATAFVESFENLADEELIESANRIRGQSSDEIDTEELSEGVEAIQTILTLAEEFIGDFIPIRIDAPDYTYVTALGRENMRISPRNAFFERSPYTFFGRVKRRIDRDEEWDPIEATRVTGRYIEDEDVTLGQQIRDVVRTVGADLSIDINENDLLVSGHTAEIHPIAVYW